MKHYIDFEEFMQFVLQDRPAMTEFKLPCEDFEGDTTYVNFRVEQFFDTFIVYTSVFLGGIGIIQNDANGWDGNLQRVWEDITGNLELSPYFETEISGKNLFE